MNKQFQSKSNLKVESKEAFVFDEQKIMEAYLHTLLDGTLESETMDEQSVKGEPLDLKPSDWKESPFQALMFKIHDLKLAVPLLHLGSVVSSQNKIAQIFSKPEGYLGLIRERSRSVHVVAPIFCGISNELKGHDKPYRYYLCINGSDWAFACHEILHTKVIDPTSVHWRSQVNKSPWVSGTVVSEMCSLLDVQVLISNFESKFQKEIKLKSNHFVQNTEGPKNL